MQRVNFFVGTAAAVSLMIAWVYSIARTASAVQEQSSAKSADAPVGMTE